MKPLIRCSLTKSGSLIIKVNLGGLSLFPSHLTSSQSHHQVIREIEKREHMILIWFKTKMEYKKMSCIKKLNARIALLNWYFKSHPSYQLDWSAWNEGVVVVVGSVVAFVVFQAKWKFSLYFPPSSLSLLCRHTETHAM